MIHKPMNYLWIILIVFLNIRHYNAQAVNQTTTAATIITTSTKDPGAPAIVPRFFDYDGRRGNPNLQEPRFGNSRNNYPENPFLPYGNQNNYPRKPQPVYDWNHQDPSQLYFPGRPYQRPENYPGDQGYRPYPQRPNNLPPAYNPGFNPNYPRPRSYPNGSGDKIYPSNINRPYPNGEMPLENGYPSQPTGMPEDNNFPQSVQYPPQANYPNQPPNNMPTDYQPNYPNSRNNIPGTDIQFPGNNVPYPPANELVNQGNVNVRPNQNNNYPTYPSEMPDNNQPYLPHSLGHIDSLIQFPDDVRSNQMQDNNVPPGLSNVSQSQLAANPQPTSVSDLSTHSAAGILDKPVFVPTATSSSAQPVSDGS